MPLKQGQDGLGAGDLQSAHRGDGLQHRGLFRRQGPRYQDGHHPQKEQRRVKPR
ncbi:MAG TPA: hypothetical protein PLX92_05725 [Anaerolineaceae bacterium]|nr:hypothetical protein [Anaerolineaceae bacterium]HUM49688.1 hypothetical protein [Anaerolineaceae bacterium]